MLTFRDTDPNGVFITDVGFICYDPANLNVRVASDCTIAFGVDLEYLMDRNAYVVHEMGKPPDFVMEVASESTARADIGRKRGIYQQIGVPEYWRFDPSGGKFYGQALAGDRLVNGVYQPMTIASEADGEIWGYSEILRLCLCYDGKLLRFYDRASGRYLMTEFEEHAAFLAQQDELESQRAQLEASRAEAEAQRAMIQELQERLRSQEDKNEDKNPEGRTGEGGNRPPD